MSSTVVLGVDRFARGWVGALVNDVGVVDIVLVRELKDLVAGSPAAECIAVDMPIGLLEAGTRPADVAAQKFVGPRRSSVFLTPPRPVLGADQFDGANAIAPEMFDGRKISRQAWALKSTILEVDAVATHDRRVIEVHPEVSFRAMLEHDLQYSKHSWNGLALRRGALAKHGLVLPDHLGSAGECPAADVLDALAAAWSARRFAKGNAAALPSSATPGRRETITY